MLMLSGCISWCSLDRNTLSAVIRTEPELLSGQISADRAVANVVIGSVSTGQHYCCVDAFLHVYSVLVIGEAIF